MRLVTSILFGAIGTALRFAASTQMAGFKMHALGVTLIVLGITGVVASTALRSSWLAPRARSGDTVLLGHMTSSETLTLDR